MKKEDLLMQIHEKVIETSIDVKWLRNDQKLQATRIKYLEDNQIKMQEVLNGGEGKITQLKIDLEENCNVTKKNEIWINTLGNKMFGVMSGVGIVATIIIQFGIKIYSWMKGNN